MEDEPEDSELHEEGPKHRKAAIRLKPSKFHWYAHGSNSPTMSTENSQLEQALRKKMLHQTKEESNKDPFAEMMDTVKVMSLPELANLPMQAGRYKGLTCQEVLETDPGYVLWLNQHHPCNPRFLAVREYARRSLLKHSAPRPARSVSQRPSARPSPRPGIRSCQERILAPSRLHPTTTRSGPVQIRVQDKPQAANPR